MAQSRNFSYEELPLNQQEQEPSTPNAHSHSQSRPRSPPQYHLQNNDQYQQPYRDSPTRASEVSSLVNFSTPLSAPLEARVSPAHRYHPSAHPDSRFGQPSDGRFNHRRSSSSRSDYSPNPSSPDPIPPPPPPHRRKPVGQGASSRLSGQDQEVPVLAPQRASYGPYNDESPGRRVMDGPYPRPKSMAEADRRSQHSLGRETGTNRRSYFGPDSQGMPYGTAGGSPKLRQKSSYSSSNLPIAAGAATPGSITPNLQPSEGSSQHYRLSDYQSHQLPPGQYSHNEGPYQNSSLNYAPHVSEANINPQDIADDGDDGFMPVPKRKPLRNMTGFSSRENTSTRAMVGGAAAPAGGFMGALGGLGGRKQSDPTAPTAYDAVPQPGQDRSGGSDPPSTATAAEKSEWLSRQTTGRKKLRWIVGFIIGFLIVLAVVGGILGGVLGARSVARKNAGPAGSDGPGDSVNNAKDDLAKNGDLNKNSGEIKALMKNPDFHKVFPAIDYTPWGTQYPLCTKFPPSQNNITRDLAVLSQLTNVVRLYGTDCNQTEMVLHAIKQLELKSMKVWLGVWIDTNTTTNDRQLKKMYKILEETEDHSIFKGIIVGNEALYRAGPDKSTSELNLIKRIKEVKKKTTDLGYDLLVTTSDLGDNWTSALVQAVDVIMSNIHPFFAGIPADEAAGWTYSFWTNKNDPLVLGTDIPQVISEIGWPSGGGNDCGTLTTKCATKDSGSVAGVKEMNILMDDFICQALDNGTDFFWFEAFDEPWKVSFNTPGQEWEDKWGMMDPGRNLKPGLKIPDCGGKTVK